MRLSPRRERPERCSCGSSSRTPTTAPCWSMPIRSHSTPSSTKLVSSSENAYEAPVAQCSERWGSAASANTATCDAHVTAAASPSAGDHPSVPDADPHGRLARLRSHPFEVLLGRFTHVLRVSTAVSLGQICSVGDTVRDKLSAVDFCVRDAAGRKTPRGAGSGSKRADHGADRVRLRVVGRRGPMERVRDQNRDWPSARG